MPVSESRFNMWRGVVALAHADNKVEPSEREFVTKYFETVDFSHDQQLQLLEELEDPQDINEIFPKITDSSDRSELVLFARMMCWADGDLHNQEEEILKFINSEVIRQVDLDLMMQQTDAAAREAQRSREEAGEEDGGLGSVFRALGDQLNPFRK